MINECSSIVIRVEKYNLLSIQINHSSGAMLRPISNVVDIRPAPKKPWTVIVQVSENNHVQQSESGKDYKKLVFTDS
ncbi:hypothetical protein Tco_1478078 [Tanacetum coccineum]